MAAASSMRLRVLEQGRHIHAHDDALHGQEIAEAAAVGIDPMRSLHVPITQQHVADTLGLSIVHTNKTLRKLADRNLIRWLDRSCEVLDVKGLLELADWDGSPAQKRPFI